ncbi:metallophosphoesterase [Candidatus Pacearchaeota archaeon]|nr:metallophosphoesterase [Candidatus Pacearchaeota archaeon]
MKILVIGDPHGYSKYKKSILKQADVILITGDLGKVDLARKWFFDNLKRKAKGLEELEKDAKYIKTVDTEVHNSTIEILNKLRKFAPVYTIQGNVGITTLKQVRRDKKEYGIKINYTLGMINNMKNIFLVKNRLRKINNLRVGFLEYFVDTSWVNEFKPKDFKKEMKKAKNETSKAKKVLKKFKKIDILVCHQPPYGILDKVSNKYDPPKKWIGKHAGSKVILEYTKKKQPRYVFCGHIHEAKGKKKIGKTEVYNVGHSGDYILLDID